MIGNSIFALVFIAAIGSGVIGGVFFAFSSFVMAALARVAPDQGVAAMNAINVTVINASFLTAFMGTALICLVLMVCSFFWVDGTASQVILAASLLYLMGTAGVTMMFNVPLNDQLAVVSHTEAATLWARYLKDWTMWNHVRTITSIAAAILFTMALTVT